MHIRDIILEAVWPAQIPTGGKGSISNPAYSDTAMYEGDPSKFDFAQQKKSYDALSSILAWHGQKFTYLAVARAPSRLLTFVATAPNLVWYRYGSTNPMGAQNTVYVKGTKMHTSKFIGMTAVEQDSLLSDDTSALRMVTMTDTNVLTYIKHLISTRLSGDALAKKLSDNKTEILAAIKKDITGNNIYKSHSEIQRRLDSIEKLLTKVGVTLPWSNHPKLKSKFNDKVTNEILGNLGPDAWLDRALRMIFDSVSNNISIDLDKIRPQLIKHKTDILDKLSHAEDMIMNTMAPWKYLLDYAKTSQVIRALNIPWKEASFSHIFLMLNDINIRLHLIKCAMKYVMSSGQMPEDVSIVNKLLKLDWPELTAESIKKVIDKNKNTILKDKLEDYTKYGHRSKSGRADMLGYIADLKRLGIDWPELDTIKNSVNASIAAKSVPKITG